MNGYYYPKRVSGQYKQSMTKLSAGYNDYEDSFMIPDNCISEAWNAYKNANSEIVSLNSSSIAICNALIASNMKNETDQLIVSYCSENDMTGDTHMLLLTYTGSSGHDYTIDYFVDLNYTDNTKTATNISSYTLATTLADGSWSMCTFYTEAARYVCWVSPQQAKLLTYDFTTLRVVTLPFTPRKICSHYNRIFAIDNKNKLWWCRAGDFNTWYGTATDDDKIVTSTNMVNSTYTIAAQPDVPRVLSVTIVKTSTIDTLGTITIVGTDVNDAALTEVITPIDGTVTGTKVFKTVTSVTGAGWSAVAGTDNIKVGVGAIGTGYVQDDAGFWTFEQEINLSDLASLNNNLYVFSPTNIYCFSGYSYDTFSASKVVSSIGMPVSAAGYRRIAVCGGRIYFIDADNVLWEFDGESYPRIVSHPVYTNGANTNGVYGGIAASILDVISLGQMIYVIYHTYTTTITGGSIYHKYHYYTFDTKSRDWWKREGLYITCGTQAGGWSYSWVYYAANQEENALYTMYGISNGTTLKYYWVAGDGGSFGDTAYLVTKAFVAGVAEDLSLSEINILCRVPGAPLSIADSESLTVSVSKLVTGDTDWHTIGIKYYDSFATKDLQCLRFICNGDDVARVKAFRVYVEWYTPGGYELEIFGIQLNYRAIGRSR